MRRIFEAISWYAHSRTAFSVHSPLLYSFCTEVLDDDRHYYAFQSIEKERNRLMKLGKDTVLTDLAGARANQPTLLGDSLKRAASPPWKGRFLFRLSRWWQPDAILEIGTHLGISGAYLASANKEVPLWTVDRSAQVQEMAFSLCKGLEIKKIVPICQDWETGMEHVPWGMGKRWLIYIDADHRSESVEWMLKYLSQHLAPPFAVAIDDIRWSGDMQKGWKRWSSQGKGAWIDLFQGGLWLADDAFLEPVRMSLIPRRWKPLRLGWI